MAVDLQGVEVSCGGLWNVSWSIISGKGGVAANATVTDFSMVIDLVKDEKTGLVNHSKVTHKLFFSDCCRLILAQPN